MAFHPSAWVEGECVDAMGVRGRDGVLRVEGGWSCPRGAFQRRHPPGIAPGWFWLVPEAALLRTPSPWPARPGEGRIGRFHLDLFQGAQLCAGRQTK